MALNNTKGQIRLLDSSININIDELTTSEASQITALSKNAESKRLFRTDLLMFAEGTLFANDRQYDSKDLSLVAGVYNYAQGITHRLMTARGTMPGDPSFGVPWFDYLGVPYADKSSVRRMLIADITNEIFKDSRTSQVISIIPEFVNPTTVQVSCSIMPVQLSTSIDLSVTVGE